MCVFIVTVTFLPSYCLATIRGFLSSNDRGCTYRHIDCLEGCIKCAVEMGSGTVIYIVREYSDETLGNRWIGRGGPITWLPCSPDLNVLDFFLGGPVKAITSPIVSIIAEHHAVNSFLISSDLANTAVVNLLQYSVFSI